MSIETNHSYLVATAETYAESNLSKVQILQYYKYVAAKDVFSWKKPMAMDVFLKYLDGYITGAEVNDLRNMYIHEFINANIARFN